MVLRSLMTRKPMNSFESFLKIWYNLIIGICVFFVPDLISNLFRKKKQIGPDSTVLITGGGSGIGQLMALRFLSMGARVAIWDVNPDGLDRTKQMAQNTGLDVGKLFIYQMNLADPKSIQDAATAFRKDLGNTVNILINNAGVVTGQSILDMPAQRLELTMKVNVLAHFYMIREFLPDMIEQQNGHIVTIASMAGETFSPNLTDYCASKFANIGMHRSLQMELVQANLDDKIGCLLVKPFFIDTGMFQGSRSAFFSFLKPDYVVNKIIQAIQYNQSEITLPWYLQPLVMLFSTFPSRCNIPLSDFFGSTTAMEEFKGHQQPQIINNNIHSNQQTKKIN